MIGDGLVRFFAPRADFDKTRTAGLADAVDSAAGQLRLLRKIEQAILEARRAQVGDKDFHILRSVRNPTAADCRRRENVRAGCGRLAAAGYFLKKASSTP